jgi:hypothetical protein
VYDHKASNQNNQRDFSNSPAVVIQHALHVLGEIFLHWRDYDSYCYTVFLGISIHDNAVLPLMAARLFSSSAIIIHMSKDRRKPSKAYMDAALLLDDRGDPGTSLVISLNKGIFMLLNGEIESSIKFLDVSYVLSRTSCNLPARFKSSRIRCSVTYLKRGKLSCESAAIDLLALSIRYERWEGKFWGSFHTINCLFLEPNSTARIQEKSKELAATWSDGPQSARDQLLIKISQICVTSCIPLFVFKMFVNEPGNLVENLKDLVPLLNQVRYFDWDFFECVSPLILCFFAAISHKRVTPSSGTSKIIQKVCAALHGALKKLNGLSIALPLRKIFKGIRLLAVGKQAKAVEAWKKGLNEASEAKLYQGILLVAIGHYGVNETECADNGRQLMANLQCSEFENILRKFA